MILHLINQSIAKPDDILFTWILSIEPFISYFSLIGLKPPNFELNYMISLELPALKLFLNAISGAMLPRSKATGYYLKVCQSAIHQAKFFS